MARIMLAVNEGWKLTSRHRNPSLALELRSAERVGRRDRGLFGAPRLIGG